MAECSLAGLLSTGGPLRVTVRPCCLAALRMEKVVDETLPGAGVGEPATFQCVAAESPVASGAVP